MHVSFILDETGSMDSVKQQTISGFNEYVGTMKREKNAKDIRFTLTQFNSEKIDVVYDSKKLDKVSPLSDKTYQPNYMTPLYDAIGLTITSMERKLNGKDQKALVVIQTDGLENDSKEYSQKKIFKLIEKKKKKGWTFAFLGADQDAWLASRGLGISRGNTLSYKSAETNAAFRSVAAASALYSRSGGLMKRNLFSEKDQ